MAKALRNNCDSITENNRHLEILEEKLLDGLKSLKYKRNGSDNHIKGIVSLSFPNQEGEAILHRLDLMGVMVSTGSACDSVNTQISHVLKSIGIDESLAKGTIRISLGKNNTEEDIEYIVDSLKKIIKT